MNPKRSNPLNAGRRVLLRAAATLAAAASLFAAAPAFAQAPVKIRIGYIPVGVYAYFWRAQEAGYFKQAGFEVELVPLAGGGQIIPALESGDLQFGISDISSALNARNGGVKVKFVTVNFYQTKENPVHAVVSNDPSVKTPKDLEGKTVVTNLKFNTDWTVMRAWLRQNGVDLNKVTFQELGFPDMLAALGANTVAAAGVIEPFYTIVEGRGYKVLGRYFADVRSPIAVSGVMATEAYLAKNGPLVQRFVGALDKAVADLSKDPAAARALIAKNTKTPPDLIPKIRLGVWDSKADPAQIQFWIDRANGEKLLTEKITVQDVLWTAPR